MSLLYENDETVTSGFDIASLFNISFQKVFKRYDNHQSFKLAQKHFSKIKLFSITYEEIKNSIEHPKHKIIRT